MTTLPSHGTTSHPSRMATGLARKRGLRLQLDAHDDPEAEGEVIGLPALTSANEEKCSGRETRTLNLVDPLEQDRYQHPLE